MPLTLVPVIALTQGSPAPDSGEVHLRNLRQLTFGGQNAEAYFSATGRLRSPAAHARAGLRRRAVFFARRQADRVPRLPSAHGGGLGRVPLAAGAAPGAPPQDGSLGDERGRNGPAAGDAPAGRELRAVFPS